MIWKFWKKPEETVKSPQYDMLTDEYFSGDPKLIWQHQISGAKNFDSFSFLGALTDLSEDPKWREAFTELPNSDLFIKRLNAFYDLHRNSLDADNDRNYAYFSPTKKETSENAFENSARDFISLIVKISDSSGKNQLSDQIKNFKIEFVNSGDTNSPDNRIYTALADIGDDENSIYEIWGDLFAENQKPEWAHIHYCLLEACYGLATDYYLAYWLLEDFYTINLDTQAYYEFVWVNNGSFYIDHNTIHFFQMEGR